MTWSTNYGFVIYGTAIRWLSHDNACTMHRTTMTIITNWGKEILFTTYAHQVHVYIQLYFYNLIYCIINNLVCVSFIDFYHFPPSSGAQIRCQRSGFLPYLPAEALQSSVAATLVRPFFFFDKFQLHELSAAICCVCLELFARSLFHLFLFFFFLKKSVFGYSVHLKAPPPEFWLLLS